MVESDNQFHGDDIGPLGTPPQLGARIDFFRCADGIWNIESFRIGRLLMSNTDGEL